MKTSKWIINNTQNLTNKTVVITGSTSGLGLHTSKILATLGANLIFLNRDETKSQALKDELQKQNPKIKIDIIKTDMSSIKSVKNAISVLKNRQIDYLILNAGAYALDLVKTDSGYNNIFTINFISPYLLAKALIPNLQQSSGKIVAVGSISYKFSKTDEKNTDFSNKKNANLVYGNSKRFLMFALTNLINNANNVKLSIAHPGITFTNITSNYPKFLKQIIKLPMKIVFTSPKRACLNTIYAMFNDCQKNEWIGPKICGIWGKPKKQHIKISEDEMSKVGLIADNICEKLL